MQPERLWRKRFLKEIDFKSGVKTEGVKDGESKGEECDVMCAG